METPQGGTAGEDAPSHHVFAGWWESKGEPELDATGRLLVPIIAQRSASAHEYLNPWPKARFNLTGAEDTAINSTDKQQEFVVVVIPLDLEQHQRLSSRILRVSSSPWHMFIIFFFLSGNANSLASC